MAKYRLDTVDEHVREPDSARTAVGERVNFVDVREIGGERGRRSTSRHGPFDALADLFGAAGHKYRVTTTCREQFRGRCSDPPEHSGGHFPLTKRTSPR
jgi:hypothetical protein